ncbi:MAG: Na/Pi cotransporter family protein [Limnochordia bacterium]
MIAQMIFGLLGGLGLFLFGMHEMGDGLQKAAGSRMRRWLEVLTANKLLGVLLGTVITSIIQSSSATTVMVVGFVNAGLMNLSQAIGIIMGANIGTTITAQLIAFDLGEYAWIFVAIGALFFLFGRRKMHRYWGEILLGFGLLFIGIETMTGAMKPLRASPVFSELMLTLSSKWYLGLLVGAGVTAVVQSSSATTGIIQGLARDGLVPLELALPVLFGNNIGTTITAMLSSIGTSVNARRAAMSHLLFNVIGALIFLPLLPLFTRVVRLTASSITRQIANAHTVFNVTNTLILLPLAGVLAYAVTRLIPDDPKEKKLSLHLDSRLLATPEAALQQAFNEVMHMGEMALEMLAIARDNVSNPDEEALGRVAILEDAIDQYEEGITHFLVELSKMSLSDSQAERHRQLYNLINDIERVGDHGNNVGELLEHKAVNQIMFSEAATRELLEFLDYTLETFHLALMAWQEGKPEHALAIKDREAHIDEQEEDLRRRHIDRLNQNLCSPISGVVYLDIISNLERIGDHAANIGEYYLGTRMN